MKTLIIFILISLFNLYQGNEFYHIVRVDGEIINIATGQPLTTGDEIKPNDQLRFSSPYATAIALSNLRGKFTISMPENTDIFDDNQLLAMASSAVSPIGSRMQLSTRGIGGMAVKDFKNFLGEEDFYVIGNELSVKLDKNVYPMDENNFFVFVYQLNGEKKSKKIGYSGQEIKIEKHKLLEDMAIDSSTINSVQVYRYNKEKNKNVPVTTITMSFLDQSQLQREFTEVIDFLKTQELQRPEIMNYMQEYFRDIYGKTDNDKLFLFINQNINN
ncbi:MAG: hypothetical protein ACOC2E_08595 [Bacteroidota bacterium]